MKRNSKGVLGVVTVMGAFIAAAPGSSATRGLPETSGMQPRAEVSDAALDVVKTKAVDARLAARKKGKRKSVPDPSYSKKESIKLSNRY